MGQRLSAFCKPGDKSRVGAGGTRPSQSSGRNFDPDEKWSNLYREREKNHLYKWVGVRSGEFFFEEKLKGNKFKVLKFPRN
jgi:hypothetical protein